MKNNEGYALPFVLIVMVIICLVGISIMSSSLNNLQNQKASIERMQDQYEAAGKVERLSANINSVIENSYVTGITKDMLMPDIQEGSKEIISCEFLPVLFENSEDNVKELIITFETIPVDGEEVIIKGKISITPNPDGGTITKDNQAPDSYKFMNKPIFNYSSYEIVDVSEGGVPDEK